MVQQVTNGIKISAETKFIGTSYVNGKINFGFNYSISIKNQSNDTVQLLRRHWNIFDSLSSASVVEGSGVVGKKPVLNPGESHTYTSHCILTSDIGSMNGYFEMVNFATTKTFKVSIPTFQLMVPGALN